MKVYGAVIDGRPGCAGRAFVAGDQAPQGARGSRPFGLQSLPHVNGMCNTISQNSARSCCTQSGLVQRRGFAVALAAQGRRGWPCAVALETVFCCRSPFL